MHSSVVNGKSASSRAKVTTLTQLMYKILSNSLDVSVDHSSYVSHSEGFSQFRLHIGNRLCAPLPFNFVRFNVNGRCLSFPITDTTEIKLTRDLGD